MVRVGFCCALAPSFPEHCLAFSLRTLGRENFISASITGHPPDVTKGWGAFKSTKV